LQCSEPPVDWLFAGLDRSELERILESVRADAYKRKLAGIEGNVENAWRRVQRLKLDDSPPLTILELGPGGALAGPGAET
jgi:hypothetical protein